MQRVSSATRAWDRAASYPNVLWLPGSALLVAVLATCIAWASETQYSFQETEERTRACRCMPGDDCWPSTAAWDQLNSSVGGRLIATQPIGSPCHDPTYNPEGCEYLKKHWTTSSLHDASSHSIMAPFFANRSCDVWTPREWPCEMGNYVEYSVNVSEPAHISKCIAFAKERNIRLVIRNTGHDYSGKSTGAGALAIWTHHLKDIRIFNYHDTHYTGKTMKMGAGVQAFEAYEAADRHGLAVVGGECPTVGLAGGYTQGGGHSALASKYGLGADQTLEWEVIDGTGNFHRATRSENSDLYWALSGGGGGTYGVVYSMTVKAHLDIPITGAKLAFTREEGQEEAFWKAIEFYHSVVHSMSEAGGMTVYVFTSSTFNIMPLTMPGISEAAVKEILMPFTKKLSELGVAHELIVRESPGYLAHHNSMFDPILVGIAQYGGWLMPQSVVEKKNQQFTQVSREIVEDGAIYIGISINVTRSVAGDVYNAVLPAWRDAGISVVITSPWNESATWEERLALQQKMTDEWIPKLASMAPDSGCYMNEGDFRQPDWKTAFYGENYDRLLSIKLKYDPYNVFYGLTAVGSDFWDIQADGRLCETFIR